MSTSFHIMVYICYTFEYTHHTVHIDRWVRCCWSTLSSITTSGVEYLAEWNFKKRYFIYYLDFTQSTPSSCALVERSISISPLTVCNARSICMLFLPSHLYSAIVTQMKTLQLSWGWQLPGQSSFPESSLTMLYNFIQLLLLTATVGAPSS